MHLIRSHAPVDIQVPQMVILLQKTEELEMLCSPERQHDSLFWMAEATRKPTIPSFLCQILPRNLKGNSEYVPNFTIKQAYLAAGSSIDCFPATLTDPCWSYCPFLTLWLKLGKKWTQLVTYIRIYSRSQLLDLEKREMARQTGSHMGVRVLSGPCCFFRYHTSWSSHTLEIFCVFFD